MSNVSLNEAEITTMVQDIVKDRNMYNPEHQQQLGGALNQSTQEARKKRKPALSLSQMAAELEKQENLALHRKQQEEALR